LALVQAECGEEGLACEPEEQVVLGGTHDPNGNLKMSIFAHGPEELIAATGSQVHRIASFGNQEEWVDGCYADEAGNSLAWSKAYNRGRVTIIGVGYWAAVGQFSSSWQNLILRSIGNQRSLEADRSLAYSPPAFDPTQYSFWDTTQYCCWRSQSWECGTEEVMATCTCWTEIGPLTGILCSRQVDALQASEAKMRWWEQVKEHLLPGTQKNSDDLRQRLENCIKEALLSQRWYPSSMRSLSIAVILKSQLSLPCIGSRC